MLIQNVPRLGVTCISRKVDSELSQRLKQRDTYIEIKGASSLDKTTLVQKLVHSNLNSSYRDTNNLREKPDTFIMLVSRKVCPTW